MSTVFPRAWCQKNGMARERYDTINNKTPISSKTNQIVGGDAPSLYLARLPKKGATSDTAIDTHLESHLIGPQLLRSHDFYGLVGRRQKAMLGMIAAATGKAIYRGTATDDPVENIIEDEGEGLEAAEKAGRTPVRISPGLRTAWLLPL
ncbi:hypothetical protein [Epibacterium sp. Ofav1-8]|uniref:hypothetical protein n=1 Tax=Epibacterium sp. Ofav1-8 TaxID=2917735 RepID=UPI001EF6AFEE|nr:hypothetical protein [Epibacterium sp. Ofav1-8]MCG7624979.1 hypothetical protein [Epibacterium sp. Ofav1-8]